MFEILENTFSRFRHFSKKLSSNSILSNYRWVLLGEIDISKKIFIFSDNHDLLLFEDGILFEKGNWNLIGEDSLVLELKIGTYLFMTRFVDKDIVGMKLNGKGNILFLLINESRYGKEINDMGDVAQFLINRYGRIEELVYIEKGYNLTIGNYQKFKVELISGRKFDIYYRTNYNKYCILLDGGWIQFDTKEQCILYLNDRF